MTHFFISLIIEESFGVLYSYSIVAGKEYFLSRINCKDSTIGDEKKNNPRLQVNNADEYAEIMNNLNLANPKMMDIAVPANLKGLTLDEIR